MSKSRYRLVAIGAGCLMVCISLGTTCLSFMVGPITSEFGYDRSTFTIYSSLISLVGMFTMPFIGRMIGKQGIQKVVIAGGIWCAICFVAFSFCSSLISFYIVGALLGVMLFGMTSMAAAVVVNTWFVAKKGTVMGLVMSASGVSGAVFGLFFPQLIENMGWRTGYLVLAACMFVFSVPVGIFLLRKSPAAVGMQPYGQGQVPQQAGASEPAAVTGVPYQTAVKSKPFYLCFAIYMLISVVTGVLQHLPAMFSGKGLSAIQAGSLMSVLMLAMIFAKIIMGTLNDKVGVVTTSIIVFALTIVGFLMLPVSNTYLTLVVAAIILSFGMGSPSVLPALVTSKAFGQKDYTAIWGTIAMAGPLGTSIGAPVWGAVYDITGSYTMGIFGAVVLVAAVALMVVICIKASEKSLTAVKAN